MRSRRFYQGSLIIGLLAVLLAVLHQDFWWWDDAEPFVLGFLPIGLAYHAAYSIAAALLWLLALKIAWPHHIEQQADLPGDGPDQEPSS